MQIPKQVRQLDNSKEQLRVTKSELQSVNASSFTKTPVIFDNNKVPDVSTTISVSDSTIPVAPPFPVTNRPAVNPTVSAS